MSYRIPTLALAAALLVPAFSSCSTEDEQGSAVKTQLGVTGNQLVAKRFKEYKTSGSHCEATGSGKRVLVTGFGLFTGVDYNISGVVVGSYADGSGAVASGILAEENKGAVAKTRSLTINGKSLEVCFLTLDVQWDLAAAIIINETESFQPAFVLMTGRGSDTANFEAGALNKAMTLSGFESDGDAHTDNTPQYDYILMNRPAKSWMAWNPAQLKAGTQDLIQSIGHQVTFASAPRSDNTYICNNVSYVVLEAIKGAHISLAGGYLRMNPVITGSPKAGFFHFPAAANNSPEDVAVWVKVLAKIMDLSV